MTPFFVSRHIAGGYDGLKQRQKLAPSRRRAGRARRSAPSRRTSPAAPASAPGCSSSPRKRAISTAPACSSSSAPGAGEAETLVIGRIADQQYRPGGRRASREEGFETNELACRGRASDGRRRRRCGPSSRAVDPRPPRSATAQGADQIVRILGDGEGQTRRRQAAFAQPLAGFPPAARAEGAVEQRFAGERYPAAPPSRMRMTSPVATATTWQRRQSIAT